MHLLINCSGPILTRMLQQLPEDLLDLDPKTSNVSQTLHPSTLLTIFRLFVSILATAQFSTSFAMHTNGFDLITKNTGKTLIKWS